MPMVFKKEQLDLARAEEVGRGRIRLCSRWRLGDGEDSKERALGGGSMGSRG